ncbi:MAG: DUF3068 domain-containing protein [Dehalococcoidia bacterium]|nr:MAG: DUF3068 domain-containing protein [Dehalococcoidia bacterium]
MTTEGKPKKRFIVSIVGLLLVILGVLWITVIFPTIDKVPLDYERTYYFVGNFTLVDPATQQVVFIPIRQTLAQEAIGTEDGALLIHEKRTVFDTSTEPERDISERYGDESTIAIDRRAMKFVTKVDEGNRTGYWGPPRPIGKDDSYDLWNPGAGQPLPASFVREENFRGMNVLVFDVKGDDIKIGTEPQSGMDLYLTTTITQWVAPSSGTVVYNESVTTTSLDMMGMKVPIQVSELRYAEETIEDLMDIAKYAHTMLLWLRTIVPWILIGLGAVMVLVDVLVLPIIQARRE